MIRSGSSPGRSGWKLVRVVGEVVEDPVDRRDGVLPLLAGGRAQVDALEHEGTKVQHRMSDLIALDDVPRVGGGLDDVVDERVDPARPALPEEGDLLCRQILLVRGHRREWRRRCRG